MTKPPKEPAAEVDVLTLSETGARHYAVPMPAGGTVQTEESVLLNVIERLAADPTIDLDRVERLLTIRERMQARDAERQFTEAMAVFKTQPIRIVKDKTVAFPTQGGGETRYKHATLGAVCESIIPGLAAVGISHRWDLARENARIVVTCVLTHRAGHSTRTSWDGPPDDSGKKNTIQQSSSAISYLERYTLLAATGFGTSDQDDDGRGAAAEEREKDPPPKGYDSWKADMGAVDTNAALKRSWEKSDGLYRAYASSVDLDWWAARKEAVAGKE